MSCAIKPGLSLAISLALAVYCAGQVTSIPSVAISPQSSTDADFRSLTEKYVALYSSKEVEGLMKLWSEKSPDYALLKQRLAQKFLGESYSVSALELSRVKLEDDRATLRITFLLSTTDLKNLKKQEQKTSWNFAWVREEGHWKVWRSVPAEDDLAENLINAKAEAERTQLLAEEKDLVTPRLVVAVIDLGTRHKDHGKFPLALGAYRLAQSIAEQIGDQDGIASVYVGFGNVYEAQGNYSEALKFYERSKTIREARGDKLGISRALLGIGHVQANQGDYAGALDSFQRSLQLSEDLDNKDGIARASGSIGSMHLRQGNYTDALEWYRKVLPIWESMGNRAGMINVLGNTGGVYRNLGNYSEALALYQRVLLLSQELGNKSDVVAALNNIGLIYHSLGNYANALESSQKALTLSEALGEQLPIAISLNNIGRVYRAQGNYEQALEYYQRSLAMSEKLGSKTGTALVLNNIGLVHRQQGNYPLAVDALQKSLAIREAMGDKAGVASTLNSIGLTYYSQGNDADALAAFQKSLAKREEIHDRSGIAGTLSNIGDALQKKGDFAGALDAEMRAAKLAQEIGEVELLWKARFAEGVAHRSLKQPREARVAFEESIAASEALRANVIGGAEDQQRFFVSKVAPYHALVDLLVDDGQPAEALTFAERAKARVLLDVLQSGRINVTKAMTTQEQDRERELTGQLATLNSQVSRESARSQSDPTRLSALSDRLQKARLDYEGFRTNLYAAHSELRTQRGEAQPLKPEEAAGLIASSSSALLEYVVTDERIHLIVITTPIGKTEPEIHGYSLQISREELGKKVARFREQLADRDLGFRASAANLYELLLKPAQTQLRGKTSLVIVPDDKLWDLPFQSLVTSQRRFLIEDAAISYAPSLTVLREMTKRKNHQTVAQSTTLLAIGNPTVGKETAERAKLALRDEKLTPLPEAEQEVRALTGLYGVEHSKVYVGPEAREDLVKREAGRASILHFATHGTLNNVAPMYSHLVLAQGDANEDGLLEAWEIMQLDLKADLAILSACETARGRYSAGEGMIGLTWAMFVAGVPTTVVSQWKVEAASTRDLLVGFHRGLRSGPRSNGTTQSKAQALRLAALTVMRHPETSHPFYWAGFVLVGDGR